jgi:hypothetical protein
LFVFVKPAIRIFGCCGKRCLSRLLLYRSVCEIKGASFSDFHQPGAESGGFPQGGQLAVSGYEGLLRDVRSPVIIAQNIHRNSTNRTFVPLHKGCESRLFAVQTGLYQFSI